MDEKREGSRSRTCERKCIMRVSGATLRDEHGDRRKVRVLPLHFMHEKFKVGGQGGCVRRSVNGCLLHGVTINIYEDLNG